MTEKKENETTKGPIPKNVHEVLHYVQMNLHAPKNQYNSFGKYSYRSCEDILEGLKKVLPPNAYVTICDDIVDIGGRIYVKSTATLSYSGDEVKNSAFAREEESKKGMDSAQLTGATSSYARKYALNGLFLIDDTKDADSNESKEQAKNTPQQKQESNKPQASQTQKNDSAALKELCARIKKQILECTTPETVNYVWGGFKADLDMIKQKAPTWFDALDAEYGKKLANVSQAPISDDEIPY